MADLGYDQGYIISNKDSGKGVKVGVLTLDGIEVVPAEYDYVKIYNEYWIFAATLTKADESDYDISTWYADEDDKYRKIEKAAIIHVPGYDIDEDSEILQVNITRDQFAECQVDGDYINIRDRATGLINTYNNEFDMVASVKSLSDFNEFSSDRVLERSVKDKTGKCVDYVSKDGYAILSEKDKKNDRYVYGAVDTEGKELIPVNMAHLLLLLLMAG